MSSMSIWLPSYSRRAAAFCARIHFFSNPLPRSGVSFDVRRSQLWTPGSEGDSPTPSQRHPGRIPKRFSDHEPL